eukprot:1758543-Rhodomonas_salina.1
MVLQEEKDVERVRSLQVTCPSISYAIILRACGTDAAYSAWCPPTPRNQTQETAFLCISYAILLRACGTDSACSAWVIALRAMVSPYARAMPCPECARASWVRKVAMSKRLEQCI